MNTITITTQQTILFDMYNAIAIGDLDLDKFNDEDIIEFSEYFMNHVNMPNVYKYERPLFKKFMPIYDGLDDKDKEALLDIILQKESYKNEFFYDSINLDISDEEKNAMTDEEVTKYLKENDYILGNSHYTNAENKLISALVNLFTMMIEQVDSFELDKTTKEEYIERTLFEIDGFIEGY